MDPTLPGFEPARLLPLASALGLGLLIGVVRERRKPEVAVVAGVRTHALVALGGAIAMGLHLAVFVAVLLLVGALSALSYGRSRDEDPGLTGEIALVLTAVLGGLALDFPALAGALGVVVAALLYAKSSLHKLTRDLISEKELRDGLLLLGCALVVLPLLPDAAIGPFDVFNPATLWKLVVLVMAIGALGHVVLRATGNRWGLAVAGFFAGFVSSTAAIAGFGQRVKEAPAMLRAATGAAMLANLASLLLFVPILLTIAPPLLGELWPELLAAGAVMLVGGLVGVHRGDDDDVPMPTAQSRMFSFRQALVFAALITGVLFLSAALGAWWGPRGAIIAAIVAALAELHAAVATIGNLFRGGRLDADQARWALVGLLAAAWVSKSIVAWTSGGRSYGLRVCLGLGAATAAAAAVRVVMGETS
jgi:uncharacterized membrane protein (DUF4010 family)